MTDDSFVQTIEGHLVDAMGKIHAGNGEGARDTLLKAFFVFIKEEEFARAHGDLFDRTIGLAAVCIELAPSEGAMRMLSGAVRIRLDLLRGSSH